MLSLQAVGKRYERRRPWVVRDAAVAAVDPDDGTGRRLQRDVAGVTPPSREADQVFLATDEDLAVAVGAAWRSWCSAPPSAWP